MVLTIQNIGFKIGVQGKRKVYTKGKEVGSGEALRRIMGAADLFICGSSVVVGGLHLQLFRLGEKAFHKGREGHEDRCDRDPERNFRAKLAGEC